MNKTTVAKVLIIASGFLRLSCGNPEHRVIIDDFENGTGNLEYGLLTDSVTVKNSDSLRILHGDFSASFLLNDSTASPAL